MTTEATSQRSLPTFAWRDFHRSPVAAPLFCQVGTCAYVTVTIYNVCSINEAGHVIFRFQQNQLSFTRNPFEFLISYSEHHIYVESRASSLLSRFARASIGNLSALFKQGSSTPLQAFQWKEITRSSPRNARTCDQAGISWECYFRFCGSTWCYVRPSSLRTFFIHTLYSHSHSWLILVLGQNRFIWQPARIYTHLHFCNHVMVQLQILSSQMRHWSSAESRSEGVLVLIGWGEWRHGVLAGPVITKLASVPDFKLALATTSDVL